MKKKKKKRIFTFDYVLRALDSCLKSCYLSVACIHNSGVAEIRATADGTRLHLDHADRGEISPLVVKHFYLCKFDSNARYHRTLSYTRLAKSKILRVIKLIMCKLI